MQGLFAPLLAQLVTLTLGDRVEGDYIASQDQHYFDSRNTLAPGAAVVLGERRAKLTLAYAPTFMLVPLEERPRELLLNHVGYLGGEYRWRGTTLSLTQGASYGDRDFQRETLAPNQLAAAPTQQATPGQNGTTTTPGSGGTPTGATPGGTPATPAPGTGTGGTPTTGGGATPNGTAPTPARDLTGPVRYGSFRTSAALDHVVSRSTSFRLSGGYSVVGALRHRDQTLYPLTRGPDGTATLKYKLNGRDTLTTTATGQLAFNETGSNALVLVASEDYTHQFSRTAIGVIGAGVSLSRAEPPLGLPLYSIYPTARATLTDAERVGGGVLAVSVGATTAPALDLITATIDPRVGGFLTTGWTLERFSVIANALTAISLQPRKPAALDSLFASLGVRYELGLGFAADTGVRSVWQRYGDATLIQPSAVFFVGVSYGGLFPLNAPHQ